MSRTLGMLNMTALLVGGAAFLEDERKNRRRSMRAEDKADEALRMAEDWSSSGDKIRLQDPKVRDYLLGLSYPAQAAQESPSATATTPSVIERPYMTEDMATVPTEYPPVVNLYDSFGRLVHPSQAQDGENFLHGLVQNFSELRAADLGATFEGVPTTKKLAHVFRHHRGLMEAIAQLEAEGITLEQARDAWLRFYGSGSSRGSRVLWRLMTDTPSLTMTGTFTSFVLPANYLAVGDTAILYFSPRLSSGAPNVDFRPQVRIGNESGQLIWESYGTINPNAMALNSASSADVQVRITRRANDSSGGNRFAVSGHAVCGSDTVAGGWGGRSLAEVALDHSVDQTIALTGQFGGTGLTVYLNEGKFIRET